MKKLTVLLVLVAGLAAALSAQDLSKLPKGKWLDANWNGVWEFGADSIRLLGTDGAVIFDFKDKMKDFKLDAGLAEVKLSFSCEETGRNYRFVKATTDLDLSMEIDRAWTNEPYSVKMKFQR